MNRPGRRRTWRRRGHRGLTEAIGATLPGVSWQRCRTHYAASLMSVNPKSAWGWVRTLLHSVYDSPASPLSMPGPARSATGTVHGTRSVLRPRVGPAHLCVHQCPPGTIGVMPNPSVEEMSTRELRAELADVINAAGVHNQVTFVTSRGRRVAAVVSVTVAEAAAPDGQADSDATTVLSYAVNVAMLEDRGGTPDLTPAQIYEQYASDVLRELGHDPDRIMAAARAVTAGMADKVGYPALVRHDALAIELCQMAVELTGQVLPGGYRPGSRASTVRGRGAHCS